MSEAAPELPELIRRALDSRLRSVNVACPGIVQEYNPIKKTATVLPAIRGTVPDDDGIFQPEDLPPIQNVKVIWPKCGKISITGTLQAGDEVELVFNTRANTEWRRTGQVSTPIDERYHGLGYPVAYPTDTSDVTDSTDTDESIGRPGGLRLHFKDSTIEVGNGTNFAALANKVLTELNSIKSAFDTHTHPAPGGTTSAPTAPMPSPGSVASSNLKAD